MGKELPAGIASLARPAQGARGVAHLHMMERMRSIFLFCRDGQVQIKDFWYAS
jgi:hypothetical protein